MNFKYRNNYTSLSIKLNYAFSTTNAATVPATFNVIFGVERIKKKNTLNEKRKKLQFKTNLIVSIMTFTHTAAEWNKLRLPLELKCPKRNEKRHVRQLSAIVFQAIIITMSEHTIQLTLSP